jgi:hypothetical protein
MPISIPRYTSQVQDQATPNARVDLNPSREAFGGGASLDAVEKGVEGLGSAILDEKKKADELVVTDYNTKLTQLRNKLTYDPNDGLMTKKGKDALSAPEEYHQRYDQAVEELQKGLSNDQQRSLARRITLGHKAELDDTIQKHVYAESEKYGDEVDQAALGAGVDDAILNYQNPEKLQSALDGIKGTVYRWAQRKGFGDDSDVVIQKLEDATSKAHAGVVDRMLANGDDLRAKTYYDQVKSEVSGHDAVGLEKALEEGSVRGESQRQSDTILGKHPSMTSALDEAKKIADPKVRDAAVIRIKEEFSLQEAARRDADEKLYLKAANTIDGGGSLDQITPSEMARMAPDMRKKLQEYQKSKVEGRMVATKPEVYYPVRLMLEDPARRDEAAKYNLLQHVNDISGDDLKSLMALQAGVKKQDEKTLKALDGFQSDRDVVNGVLIEAGVNPKAKPNTSNGKLTAKFYEQVDKRIMQFQAKTNKRATNEDLRKMADDLMTEVVTDHGVLWDTKIRKFQLEPGQQYDVVVPKADADQITRALKKRGRPVSDEEVKRIYLKGKNSGG